jgi:hypothetical protein
MYDSQVRDLIGGHQRDQDVLVVRVLKKGKKVVVDEGVFFLASHVV